MEANKLVLGLVLAAAIVLAAVIGVSALAGKGGAGKFSWKDYGYDPSTVPTYIVTERDIKGGEGAKTLSLRLSVPPDTAPPAVRNAMMDAVRTATMCDKTLKAAVVLADFDDDPAKGAEFSALKAVWGPGGVAAAGAGPYAVKFVELAKPRKKPVVAKPDTGGKNPFSNEDGTVGMEFGGGG